MKVLIRIIPLLLIAAFSLAFSPLKKYVRKGKLSLERGDVQRAKKYFHKALELDSLNFGAHFGLGIMYSELLEDYPAALPHLQKAYSQHPEDTLYDLVYALAKSYHHNGEYETALEYYGQMANCPELDYEPDFRKEVQKRTADCEYALRHRNDPVPPNILVLNAGRTLNTEMPEYVPVLTPQQQIIFTSKRKDDEKEPINFIDGKYFESMYIADITPNGFTGLRRYTLPDQVITPKFTRRHQAVVSLSQDGRKLFTFKDGTIFEVDMDERSSKAPERLVIAGDKNSYQNHAYLTKDGNTLYFTSDAKGGFGGNDIYKSTKGSNGEWGRPVNLGENINTAFDEDAPFVSEDGSTLYFSSKGHEGFGNYDIYKSRIGNDGYSKPENLGAPYNSPSHDIFLVTDSASGSAYFSSGRIGGYGDLDIYKIIDLDKFDRTCPESSFVSLDINDRDSGDFRNTVVAVFPDNYRVLEYEWRLNGKVVNGTPTSFDHDYQQQGNYTISSKIMVICDTCLAPVVACSDILNTVKPYKPGADTTEITGADKDVLGTTELEKAGFDTRPMLFGFDKSKPVPYVSEVLSTNIEVLKKHPELTVELIGYADARGNERYNIWLSQRRAKSVMKTMVKSGIEPSRITSVEGRGATDFVNECGKGVKCSEDKHRQNRRVEMIIKKTK